MASSTGSSSKAYAATCTGLMWKGNILMAPDMYPPDCVPINRGHVSKLRINIRRGYISPAIKIVLAGRPLVLWTVGALKRGKDSDCAGGDVSRVVNSIICSHLAQHLQRQSLTRLI